MDDDDDTPRRPTLRAWKMQGRYFLELDETIAQLKAVEDPDPCQVVLLDWLRNVRAMAGEHLA